MYSDRELLELAAKASGLAIDKSTRNGGGIGNTGFDAAGNAVLDWHNGTIWNPLNNDGDALRLAVKLNIHIRLWQYAVEAEDNDGRSTGMIHERECSGNMEAATRREIVTAAAAIGEAMQ